MPGNHHKQRRDEPDRHQVLHQEQQQRPWNAKAYEYKVDYNDHFETPLQAYQDIMPLLDAIKLPRHDHILYDPYYCNGQTKRLLESLGFMHVLHEKRDFYKDIEEETVPSPHDTFLTNPPYSDQHKEKCLRFCLQQLQECNTPFFLLMPSYVAAKHYYRQAVGENGKERQSPVAYLVPSQQWNYHYNHPEGTGHDVCPFPSMWFCGVGVDRISFLQQAWESQAKDNHATGEKNCSQAQFFSTYQQLVSNKVITLSNRPNPRQRKKKRKPIDGAGVLRSDKKDAVNKVDRNNSTASNSNSKQEIQNNAKRSSISKSKYRDETGKRLKKRF